MAKELAKSEEMITFYHTLAAVQTNAIFRIMSGTTEVHMKNLAKQETELLRGLMRHKGEGDKCGDGQVWDESLGRCVSIQFD